MPTAASVAACEDFLRASRCGRAGVCAFAARCMSCCSHVLSLLSRVPGCGPPQMAARVHWSSAAAWHLLFVRSQKSALRGGSVSVDQSVHCQCLRPNSGPGIWFSPVGPGPRAQQHSASPGPGRDPVSNFRKHRFCGHFWHAGWLTGGCAHTSAVAPAATSGQPFVHLLPCRLQLPV